MRNVSVGFKPGDIVQLKSGGPRMTVREIVLKGQVRTSWFAGSKHESAIFPVETLTTPEESKKEQ